jgi:hypothetical protein
MIGISITFSELWPRLEPYLHVVECAEDGGVDDPRIRVEFLHLPESFGRELVHVTMPCVACLEPILPLRRRVGDGFDRLYYAPCCRVTVRAACSRGRAAALEYERLLAAWMHRPSPAAQLSLF